MITRPRTLAMILVCAMPLTALAHVKLTGSIPSAGSAGPAPSQLVLVFNQPAQLISVSVTRSGAEARKLGTLPERAASKFVLPAGKLEPGAYTVDYRTMGEDSHAMSGKISFVVAAAATSASAGQSPASAPGVKTDAPDVAATPMTEGEIRKIDPAAGTLTIKHGEIVNLKMPGMTMVFAARNPAALQGFKVGDKVRFRVVREGSKFVVTEIAGVQ